MKRLILTLLILLSTQTAHAAVGSYYTFDGTDDEIDWGDVFNSTTANRSTCIWANMTEDASADAIVGRKNAITAATAGHMLSQDTSDVVTFSVGDGTDSVTSTATTDIDGAWHRVCGTWSASGEVTAIYVDGVEEDTDTGGGSVDSLTNAVEFAVGEDGAEGNDATMSAAWVMTSANAYQNTEINNDYWHPESRAAIASVGTTMGNIPMWTGASPETDIANAFNGTPSNAASATANGPTHIMIGALGASY